jgi:excisionase family DNA binding protein
MTRFLKIIDAAEYLSVSTRTIRRMVQEGTLQFVTFPHEIRRIDREEIDALGRREASENPGVVTAEEFNRLVKRRRP